MAQEPTGDAARAFHFLVADALEALIPLLDSWSEEVKSRPRAEHLRAYAEGYAAGVDAMTAEVKDQLVARILALRKG
jgi:hypothetical protein